MNQRKCSEFDLVCSDTCPERSDHYSIISLMVHPNHVSCPATIFTTVTRGEPTTWRKGFCSYEDTCDRMIRA